MTTGIKIVCSGGLPPNAGMLPGFVSAACATAAGVLSMAESLSGCTSAGRFGAAGASTCPIGFGVGELATGPLPVTGVWVAVGCCVGASVGTAVAAGMAVLVAVTGGAPASTVPVAVGTAVSVGTGVFVGGGVSVGTGVFVGIDVFVGTGVFVGSGVFVGTGVFVESVSSPPRGVRVGSDVLVGRGVLVARCASAIVLSAAFTRGELVLGYNKPKRITRQQINAQRRVRCMVTPFHYNL